MNRQVNRWNTQRLRKVQLSGDSSVNDAVIDEGVSVVSRTAFPNTTNQDHDDEDNDDDDDDDSDDDDGLPGAYAITRNNPNAEVSHWDPTEQETSQVNQMLPDSSSSSVSSGIANTFVSRSESNPIQNLPIQHTNVDTNKQYPYDGHPFLEQTDAKRHHKAEEYDATLEAQAEYLGTKSPKKSKTRIFLVTLLILLILGAALSAIPSLSRKKKNEQNPSTSATNDNESCDGTTDPFLQCHCWDYIEPTEEIREMYEALLLDLYLSQYIKGDASTGDITSCSPENLALVWTAQDRIMAGERGDSITQKNTSNRYALVLLYTYFNGDSWQKHKNWLSPQSECTWFGIRCDASEYGGGEDVTSISLSNNNLQGTIGTFVLDLLPSLREVNLSKNRLKGTIPLNIWNHKSLEHIILDTNLLSGIVDMNQRISGPLLYLSLSRNTLSGSLPDLYGASNLKIVSFSYNKFSGTVPTNWDQLTNLETLDLEGLSDITGSISSLLPSWTALKSLYLKETSISGKLSDILENLKALEFLEVEYSRLTGTIPTAIGLLTNLASINLGFNAFTGTIPTEIGKCTKLEVMLLSSNYWKGTIPGEIERLGNLISLDLYGNKQLSGTLPDGINLLANLQEVNIQETQITCPLEDICSSPVITVYTKDDTCVSCSCCTHCE